MVVFEDQQRASNYKYALKEWGFISMTLYTCTQNTIVVAKGILLINIATTAAVIMEHEHANLGTTCVRLRMDRKS